MPRGPRPFQFVEWPVINSSHINQFTPLEVEIIDLAPQGSQFLEAFLESEDIESYDESEPEEAVVTLPESEYQKKLVAERQKGVEEGRAKGLKEAQETARREYEEKAKELEKNIHSAVQSFREMTERAEVEAVRLALDVAKRIVEVAAEAKPEYIASVIKAGLESMGAGRPVRIRLSEQDYEFMQVVGLPTEITAEELGIEYVEDESLRSGCVIETTYGEVDLRLEQMWEQISEQIFGERK